MVRADDDYRADGPMTIPYDPITGEPISTVRPGWELQQPLPHGLHELLRPVLLEFGRRGALEFRQLLRGLLKFHTYFDSDMKFNYECEAAVDRYGCGPPVDELSGWMCVVRVRSFPCAPSTRQLLDGVRGQLVEPSAMACGWGLPRLDAIDATPGQCEASDEHTPTHRSRAAQVAVRSCH